ncbi:MAG: hypothetical protein KDA22_00280 [Phycisphaerales bacterium]|nr:hypothetical protein [Phycisphaerales bacterium]
MPDTPLSTHQKALRVNLDDRVHGTFAEIGAGQEVARWFFHVGAAANTVAKAISAYDMAVSDAIYGPSDRYVSRSRLSAMLDREYSLLLERLAASHGANTSFFVFADTVATRRFGTRDNGRGWMGVRFQSSPGAEPSEILLHVATCDPETQREQEAIGVLGVNLLYGAVYLRETPAALVESLMDHLTRDRIEVDMIRFQGPAFAAVDNRVMSLHLVEHGLTDAAMFNADGDTVEVADVLHKQAVLVERGRFQPVTRLTIDLLEQALAQMTAEPELANADPPLQPVVLTEMTLRDLRSGPGIDKRDFLARADLLRRLGRTVIVSNHGAYYELAEHLARCTDQPIGIALGVPALAAIFDERYYDTLPGRLLEAAGRLFRHNVRLYLYPRLDRATGAVVTADTLRVPSNIQHLYAHLRQNRYVVPIESFDRTCLGIDPDDVLRLIAAGDPRWEQQVPPEIADTIRNEHLFGCIDSREA